MLEAIWVTVAVLYGLVLFVRWLRRRTFPRPKSAEAKARLKWLLLYFAACAVVSWLRESTGFTGTTSETVPWVMLLVGAVFACGFAVARYRAKEQERMVSHAEQARRGVQERTEEQRRLQTEDAKRRRDAARARCETAYHVHAPELAARFPRASFDEFCTRHLGDSKPVEVVEARAEELLGIIRAHLAKTDPPKPVASLEVIMATFESRRRKIETARLDVEDEDYLIAQLNDLRDEAIRRAVLDGTL